MAERRENGAGTLPKQETNGRWSLKISYRDPETGDIKRTTIRGASQTEVLAKKKEFKKSIAQGVKPVKKESLQDWLYTWLEVNKKGIVSNKTYNIYKTIVDCHIKDSNLGKIALDRVKRADIQKFLNDKGNTLAPRYLNHIKSVIADSLNVAELDGMILRTPCKNIKLPQITKQEINPLTQDEVKLLLETAGPGSFMYNVIFLALHTGMRRGEICGLRWDDIDFKKKLITVRQQAKVEKIDDASKIVLGELKTQSSYRVIPMDNRLIEVLRWHRVQQKKMDKELKLKKEDITGLVFCNPDSSVLPPNTVGSRFSRLMEKAAISKRTFHQLRHTFASVAISQGLNIKAISAILGHAKTSITLDTYGHLLPGDTNTVIHAVADYYGV